MVTMFGMDLTKISVLKQKIEQKIFGGLVGTSGLSTYELCPQIFCFVLFFSDDLWISQFLSVGEVAKLFADAGVICIACLISPYRKDRDACRALLLEGDFIEVCTQKKNWFVIRTRNKMRTIVSDKVFRNYKSYISQVFMDVPLQVCEARDPKGLYKLARAGKIKGNFLGL